MTTWKPTAEEQKQLDQDIKDERNREYAQEYEGYDEESDEE